jgi:hypothetical protein
MTKMPEERAHKFLDKKSADEFLIIYRGCQKALALWGGVAPP